MQFTNNIFSVRIRSVLYLEWDQNVANVPPRPYQALSFRLSGDAYFRYNGKTLHADNKSLLYAPAHTTYEIQAGSEKLIVIHFESAEAGALDFETLSPDNVKRTEELFISLLEIWNRKEPGYYPLAMSVFYKIVELIEKQAYQDIHTPHYEKIKPAIDYLKLHFQEPTLSVKDLCEASGLGETYFRKLFFEEFHLTPNKYLTDLRMDYAKDLLESGVYSIVQVAEKVGFMDPKYFCTVFKRITGHTPSDFKSSGLHIK
jgi:AraC-like DNA-binding protein